MEIITKATNTTLYYNYNYNKTSTPPTIYKQLFEYLKNTLHSHNLFDTDSSMAGILPHYSSDLSSELIAIHEAVKIALKAPGKKAICSDPLSGLQSLINSNNHSDYASTIRNLVTNHLPKMKLIWIPSHTGIIENENADKRARGT